MLQQTGTNSEPNQICKIELSVKIVNGFQMLTILQNAPP